ncbi:MAG: cytochrome c oxidase subunit 3 [Pseudomonadota bacterium]
MELILIFLAFILAVFMGWLLKQSFNTQPWVAEAVDEHAHQAPLGANAKAVALTVLLAVITSFFALMMSAYSERMELGDWVPLGEPTLLWLNTGMLVLASVAFQWTRNAAVDGIRGRVIPGMFLSGTLTIAFIAGQLAAWKTLTDAGQGVAGSPANGFFYLMTGAHALHILGGLYVWARALVRLLTGREPASVRQSIELCTVYWHFLLVVWLVMFGLLLST